MESVPGQETERDGVALAPSQRRPGNWVMFGVGLACLLGLWGGGWRCLDRWAWFRTHRAVVERHRVHVGAIFYTELERDSGAHTP